MPSPITASCFFCDEVRQESTGKFIYIGAYPTELVVPSFPAELRLVCVAQVSAPIDHPRPKSIKIRISMPGQQDVWIDADGGEEATPFDKSARIWAVNLIFPIQATCTASGRIQISMDTGEGDVYGGSLKIVDQAAQRRENFDVTAAVTAIYHFLGRVPHSTPEEKAAASRGLYETLSAIAQDGYRQRSPAHLLFAPVSATDFFVFLGTPPAPDAKLSINFRGKAIPTEQELVSPQCFRVKLTDKTGPSFYDGLQVAILGERVKPDETGRFAN